MEEVSFRHRRRDNRVFEDENAFDDDDVVRPRRCQRRRRPVVVPKAKHLSAESLSVEALGQFPVVVLEVVVVENVFPGKRLFIFVEVILVKNGDAADRSE